MTGVEMKTEDLPSAQEIKQDFYICIENTDTWDKVMKVLEGRGWKWWSSGKPTDSEHKEKFFFLSIDYTRQYYIHLNENGRLSFIHTTRDFFIVNTNMVLVVLEESNSNLVNTIFCNCNSPAIEKRFVGISSGSWFNFCTECRKEVES